MMKAVGTLVAVGLCTLVAGQARAALVAGWGFDTYTAGGAISTYAPEYGSQANSGSANLSADITGTKGKINSVTGTTVNESSPAEGATYALQTLNDTGNGNGSVDFAITLKVAGAGLQGFTVTYADLATSSGLAGQTWYYSTDGVNYTALTTGATVSAVTSWTAETVDFSSITALDGAPTIYFQDRFTFSGNGASWEFDNFNVNAGDPSVVPEPTACALPLFGLAFFGGVAGRSYLARRRQI